MSTNDDKRIRDLWEVAIMARLGLRPWDEYADEGTRLHGGRNTGATTRMLVQAMVAAAMGKRAIIFAEHPEDIRDKVRKYVAACNFSIHELRVFHFSGERLLMGETAKDMERIERFYDHFRRAP